MAQDPWAPFEPRASEWTLKHAGHLLRRATFGFTSSELRQALADGPRKTIDRLLAPPPNYQEFEQSMAALTPRESSPLQTAQLQLYRMLNSPYPFHEKQALFVPKPTPALLCTWLLGGMGVSPSMPADVSTILRSNAFFSATTYRQKVKTPIEYALNLAIPLGARLAPAQLHTQLAALGQRFPDAGSPKRWLNAFTIVGRSNLAAAILARIEHFPNPQALIESLLQNDAPPATLQGLAKLEGRDLAQAIANQPEFQLL